MKREVNNDPLGGKLLGWFGQPWVIEQLHRHPDIELNLIPRGEMHYLIGGRVEKIRAGEMALFWAVTPHRVIYCAPQTLLGVIHIPLVVFLRWMLPSALQTPLLEGKLLCQMGLDALEQPLFERWVAHINHHPEQHSIVLLELQARLQRWALKLHSPTQPAKKTPRSSLGKAEQLAVLLAEQHGDVDFQKIAKKIGLNPSYAMTLFKQTFGLTMLEYVLQHRVADAQRLLITSDLSVLDVAFEAGFGSLSRFYAAFKQVVGCSPKAYRSQNGIGL
jgi:AraC family transcriptional regulator, melibiose operon regulatory protein